MTTKFQTDALRPSALPSASLGRPKSLLSRPDQTSGTFASNIEADLVKEYEDWNKRIDEQVKGLSSGLKALIDLANIGENPTPHSFTTTSLDLQLRTSQLIRHAQNLRDISHDLKLTLLLSDQISTTERRDVEWRRVREEIALERVKWGEALNDIKADKNRCVDDLPGRGEEVNDENDKLARADEEMKEEAIEEISEETVEETVEETTEARALVKEGQADDQEVNVPITNAPPKSEPTLRSPRSVSNVTAALANYDSDDEDMEEIG